MVWLYFEKGPLNIQYPSAQYIYKYEYKDSHRYVYRINISQGEYNPSDSLKILSFTFNETDAIVYMKDAINIVVGKLLNRNISTYMKHSDTNVIFYPVAQIYNGDNVTSTEYIDTTEYIHDLDDARHTKIWYDDSYVYLSNDMIDELSGIIDGKFLNKIVIDSPYSPLEDYTNEYINIDICNIDPYTSLSLIDIDEYRNYKLTYDSFIDRCYNLHKEYILVFTPDSTEDQVQKVDKFLSNNFLNTKYNNGYKYIEYPDPYLIRNLIDGVNIYNLDLIRFVKDMPRAPDYPKLVYILIIACADLNIESSIVEDMVLNSDLSIQMDINIDLINLLKERVKELKSIFSQLRSKKINPDNLKESIDYSLLTYPENKDIVVYIGGTYYYIQGSRNQKPLSEEYIEKNSFNIKNNRELISQQLEIIRNSFVEGGI
jgi:hypothetical protein